MNEKVQYCCWWKKKWSSTVHWLCTGNPTNEKVIIGCSRLGRILFNLWPLTFPLVLFYRQQDGWGRQVQTATGGHCCGFWHCTTHMSRTFFWEKINPSADTRNICSGQLPEKCCTLNSDILRTGTAVAKYCIENVVATYIYLYISASSCIEVSVAWKWKCNIWLNEVLFFFFYYIADLMWCGEKNK